MTTQLVKLWLWISVLASAAGWVLSAIGQLNRAGYVAFTAASIVILWLGRRPLGLDFRISADDWKKIARRVRRPLPCAFAFLTLLIFIGALLYPPTNHTGLAYRLPRVLQWLAHEHWFWIHTPNYRMNDRACGIEWLTAPLLLFTRSDRLLFLLNFVPFLLLPGQIFSLWTRLGVRPRVAWFWMWLLPTGYSFLLQAGSVGNDTFPAVYALAMMDFAARAWTSRRTSDLWHSILAASLLTGAKASNLPLLLPWAILIFPLVPLFRRKLVATVGVVLVAAVVSFLPTAVLNHLYCGDWSGAVLEPSVMTVKSPVVGLWGNAFQLLLNNFVPPLFPQAALWNQSWNQTADARLPSGLVDTINANFDKGFFWVGELPTEDWAGIGFGISVLVTVAVAVSFWRRIRGARVATVAQQRIPPEWLRFVLLAPWVALLVYCAKSGMVTAARLISPFYPLLLPLLLGAPAHVEIVRRRWWRRLVWGNIVLALVVLVLTPPRPLWPAKTILGKARALKPEQRLLARAEKVYTVYSERSDPLGALRALLPRGVSVIGFAATADDLDISLWRPYGAIRVEHILLTDPPAIIHERGIQCAAVGGFLFEQSETTLTTWLAQCNAEVIATTNATMKVAEGPRPWYIVRFK